MVDTKGLDKKILVYHHRFRDYVNKDNGTPLEDLDAKGNGLGVTTYRNLKIWLKMHTEFQSVEKELKHRTSTIYQGDLVTPDQLRTNLQATRNANVASIEVPFKAWVIDRFRTVWIISRTEYKSHPHQAEI